MPGADQDRTRGGQAGQQARAAAQPCLALAAREAAATAARVAAPDQV